MKFKLTVCALIILLFTSMSFAQTSPIFVDDDYTGATPGWGVTHFNTISNGIAGVSVGGIVNVAAGTYTEHITINIPLTLRGPNNLISPVTGVRGAEAIINGTGADCSVNIQSGANPVIIEGLEFTGSNTSAAIFVDCNYVTIQKNLFSSVVGAAIQATNNTEITNRTNQLIDDNKIIDISGVNNSGIYYHKITDSAISNNSITNTTYGGIYVGDANNSDHTKTVTISNNTLSTMPQQGIWISDNSGNVIVSNNTVTNANTSSSAGKGGITIYGTLYWGTVTVQNNTVSNSFNGVAVRTGQNITGKDIHVNNNNFANNSNAGAYNGTGTGPLDATLNWWGNASGPYNLTTNPTGTGSAVSDNVTYSPWSGSSSTSHPMSLTANGGDLDNIMASLQNGDVITLLPATYNSFTITKEITITGTPGAYIDHASPAITVAANNVTITGALFSYVALDYAIQINAGVSGTIIHNCNFNVTNAIDNQSASSVNAEYNYWGFAGNFSGPGGVGPGTGGVITQTGGGAVDYDPWVGKTVTPVSSTTSVPITGQVLTWDWLNFFGPNFNIRIDANGVAPYDITASSATNSYTIAATLLYNTTYSWWVQSNTDPLGTWIGPYTFTTLLATPVATAPANLSTNGSSSVTFNWTHAPSTANVNYNVYYTTNYLDAQDYGTSFGPFASPALTSGAQALSNATLYFWYVKATVAAGPPNAGEFKRSSILSFWTTGPVLSGPANNSVGVTIIPTLSWLDATGEEQYQIQVASDNAFGTIIKDTLVSANVLTYRFTDSNPLTNAVNYYWRVRAIRNTAPASMSDWSTANFITITSAMPYLTNPSNGAILSGNTTSLWWYSGMVGINYAVQVSTNSAFPLVSLLVNDNTTNSYYTVNNNIFTQGNTYYWRIVSKTLGGVIINFSNTWQFSMPGLPQVVGSYPVGGVTIYNNPPTLYWYPLGYNSKVTEYIVRYRRAGSAMLAAAYVGNSLSNTQGIFSTTNINWFSTIPFALDGGYQYYWQVASYDGSATLTNTSYSPEENFFVYGNPTFVTCYPSYPTAGSTVYTTTPTLYWYTNVYSPIIYYKIQIDNNADFSSVLTTVDNISGNSYTVLSTVGLTSGSTYYWRVAASLTSGTSGFGSYSAGASFVVSTTGTAASVATPYPATPNSGTVIGVTNPTLTWYAYSADPLQYKVTWATNPSVSGVTGTFNTAVGTSGWMTSNSFVLSGLTAGATYYWQVQARLATTLVEGSWSTVAWFTTAAGSASVVPLAGSPINGTPINNTNATLSWILPTKSTSTLKYDVQYSKSADFTDAVTVNNLDKPYVEVKNLDRNAVYYWRASSTTNSGLTSSYSAPTSFNTGKTVTAIEEKVEQLPTQFELAQNYPNPFNPTTLISYALPQNAFVTLKVYDMLGREIKTLVSKEVAAGNYSVVWNGDDNFGNKVATGAYVYRITAGDPSSSSGQGFVSVKKMLLIK